MDLRISKNNKTWKVVCKAEKLGNVFLLSNGSGRREGSASVHLSIRPRIIMLSGSGNVGDIVCSTTAQIQPLPSPKKECKLNQTSSENSDIPMRISPGETN